MQNADFRRMKMNLFNLPKYRYPDTKEKEEEHDAESKVVKINRKRKTEHWQSDLQENDLAWYFKLDPATIAKSTIDSPYKTIQEAKTQGGIKTYFLVRVKKLHFDDYPNFYYTIEMLPDEQVVAYGRKAHEWFFEDEKQTDRLHLVPLIVKQ